MNPGPPKPQPVYVGENRLLWRLEPTPGEGFVFFMAANDKLLVPLLLLYDRYEPQVADFFSNNIKEDDHCLDIGANFGFFTCLMARRCTRGRVMAFEPDPVTFGFLRDNLYANSLSGAVTPLPFAVGDSERVIPFHTRVERPGNSSMIPVGDDYAALMGESAIIKRDVRCVPLDSYLGELGGRVDFVKLDAEGAEPLVLRGMLQTIRHNPQIRIVMEWSPQQIQAAGFPIDDFLEELEAANLKGARFNHDGSTAPASWGEIASDPYHSGILLTVG